jgi:hypothetical protein
MQMGLRGDPLSEDSKDKGPESPHGSALGGGEKTDKDPADEFDEQGRQIDTVTVTGTPPMPRMDQSNFNKTRLRLALDAGDLDEANRIHGEMQMGMSEQERMGRQQLASAAGRIIELPTHEQRVQAAQMAMEQYNIAPEETNIDDYFNNPEMLVFALGNILDGGSLQDAIKGNLAVNKFRREQMAEQEFAPVSALNLGNEQLLYGGTGDVVGRFGVGVSPNTNVTAGVQRRGQDISAATTRRGQNMTDARARTNLPAGFILDGN